MVADGYPIEDPPGDTPRSAAVLGHPVDHSLSPVLHRAAFRALGLTGWTYDRIDCDAARLPALVDASPPERVGYSVTMPGKFAALAHATEVSDRARLVGSANTLVRRGDGWFADCTDVDGAVGALAALDGLPGDGRAVVLGTGGTSRPVLVGLGLAGFGSAVVAGRRDNWGPAVETARAAGLDARGLLLDDPALPGTLEAADVVVSTVPADGAARLLNLAPHVRRLFDVLYHPWPTALGQAVADLGRPVVGGDVMLREQAYGQVELFTGRPAPRAAMAEALAAALGR